MIKNNNKVGAKGNRPNTTITITVKQVIKTSDEPPEGSRQMKVPLSCAFSMSNRSCPRVRDEHLAVLAVKMLRLKRKLIIVRLRLD